MVIGALITMAFFFAYTQVRTATQNVSFFLNELIGRKKDEMLTSLVCLGGVYVHYQLLLEHLLWHFICVHA